MTVSRTLPRPHPVGAFFAQPGRVPIVIGCPRFHPGAIWIVIVSRETIGSVRARRGRPAFKCEPTLDNNEIAQASKGNF